MQPKLSLALVGAAHHVSHSALNVYFSRNAIRNRSLGADELPGLMAFTALLVGAWLWAAGFDAARMFHTDDNYVYYLHHHLQTLGRSPWDLAVEEVRKDFGIRFRPLFHPVWVLRVYLFQDAWYLHSMWNVVCGIVSCVALTLAFRLLRFSWVSCVILCLVTFLGPQIDGFVLRFAQESLGTALLSLSLLCAVLSHKASRGRVVARILFLLFTGMAAAYKESYIVLVPALLLFNLALALPGRTGWRRTLRGELVVSVLLTMILLAGAAGIKLSGANKPDNYYAVTPSELLTWKWFSARLNELFPGKGVLTWPLIGFAAAVAAGAGVSQWGRRKRPVGGALRSRAFLYGVAIALLVTASQFPVYAGTGFAAWAGRYFLPVSLGLAFFFAFSYEAARPLLLGRVIVLAGVVAFLMPNWKRFVETRDDIMTRRHDWSVFLDQVSRGFRPYIGNCHRKVLVAWHPERQEELHTMHRYLTHVMGVARCQLAMEPVNVAGVKHYEKLREASINYYSGNGIRELSPSDQVDCIAVFRDCDDEFLAGPGRRFITPDMIRYLLGGNYVVYVRNPHHGE